MVAKVYGIRGATTVLVNTTTAIREAVMELLDTIELHNHLNTEDIISVIFTATRDLDAIFPAAIARERPNWDHIPLLDLQQMHVQKSLERCIRILIYINSPHDSSEITHVYLRNAKNLRPDISLDSILPDTFRH
ncbi:monofunctional chorismate mutase, clade 1 [Gloeocapsa sp. PCC 73106]|nr:chorismate mutase [Gloeocapsa sp. PCC 73106]ELR99196.1 monofunctional chorismate mutase, clade 1 [Gloeocapsa sp. PCC 73106]